MLQIFFFTGLAWSEMATLTVMSYDRYVAICLPLHYEVIMSPRKCTWAVAAVWLSGGVSGTLYTASTNGYLRNIVHNRYTLYQILWGQNYSPVLL